MKDYNKYYFAYDINWFNIKTIYILAKKDKILNISMYYNKNYHNCICKQINIIKDTFIQLKEYFKGQRKEFSVDYCIKGTPFQENIWNEIKNIPYGSVITYKDLGILASSKGWQAVGRACSKNPLPFIIPCHRVINSNNNIGGYIFGSILKQYMLNMEKNL